MHYFMKKRFARILSLITVFSLVSCNDASADWSASDNALAVRALPNSPAIQAQNPPTFSWSQYTNSPDTYLVEVKSNGLITNTFKTTTNWYLPASAFKNGSYTWRVTPVSHQDWSKERPFIIGPESALFEVADNAALTATVLSRMRPRMLPADFIEVDSWSKAIQSDRQSSLDKLIKEVDLVANLHIAIRDKDWPLRMPGKIDAPYAAQMTAIRSKIFGAERQLEAAALLYHLTKEQRFLDDAIQLGNQLAALEPTGPTSFVNQVQATRSIALALVKAIDILGPSLDQKSRNIWLANVTIRGNQIYNDFTEGSVKIDQYPLDSIGGTNLSYLALIATLSLGDIPAASAWFNFAVRDYSSWVMAWSGPEGGFANGTSYAQYAAFFALRTWQPLKYATGINLFAKPWTIGFTNFLIHFVPPGSRINLFGDGHEETPEFSDLTSFVSRVATPEAAWYVNAVAAKQDPIALLEAEYPLPAAQVTGTHPPPNAALYPSIGWVAMHSNLADKNRTSVYFKSSPYGSFDHSQGDQNGFVLTKSGIALLSETGWYDWYGSPLSQSWYRQTKSHNAITVDNGIGQNIAGYEETLSNNGKVTDFSSNADMDYAAGDATASYGGLLTSAIRKIWYLRAADAVVILDHLSADKEHQFEWNMHAVVSIGKDDQGTISIRNGDESVCIRPVLTDGVHFKKITGPKPDKDKFEDHAAFVTDHPAKSATFLTVLDIGCKNPTISFVAGEQKGVLQVGKQQVSIPN